MATTFTDAVEAAALGRPHDLALVDDRVRLSWGEVAAWIEDAAKWVADHQLPRQSRVLGWLPHLAEWYLLRLACERTGLLWIPVPLGIGRADLSALVARTRPDVVFHPTRVRGQDCSDLLHLTLQRAGVNPLLVSVSDDHLLRLTGQNEAPAAWRTMPTEPAHALSTTGTTGGPRLAVYTLDATLAKATSHATLFGMTESDIVLTLSQGAGPARTALHVAPLVGCAVVALRRFSGHRAVQLAQSERATIVSGTPAQFAMMLPYIEESELSSVRLWYSSGATLPSRLAENIEARAGGVFVSTYGGADFGGWCCPSPTDPPQVRHHTVGRPQGGTEIRVVNEAGDVRPGVVGQIIGRGPSCASAHLEDPALTSEKWQDGWFQLADYGFIDDTGNLHIAGRATDTINRGGEKIFPQEIEHAIESHPMVAAAVVVGIPDPTLGERVAAVIVPLGTSTPSVRQIRQHLRELGLARVTLPEKVVSVQELPLVGDKIDRRSARMIARR